MRVVFMGTPEFAATILDDLVQHHEVVAVYSRPDAVRGRGKDKIASPVKLVAEHADIIVETPSSCKDPQVIQQLKAYEPDVICVAAYGAILPAEVLDIPTYGCLNVHASLLPRWRGAAPIERAILAGDEETGVCIMRMEEGLDTGDYCICRTASVVGKKADALSDELANLGSRALVTALVHLEAHAAEWIIQNEDLVTYADKIKKHELNISPSDSTVNVVRKVLASSDAHPARAIIADKKVTLIGVKQVDDEVAFDALSDGKPGDTCFIQKRFLLKTSDGMVELVTLKPDGKQEMDARSFASGIQNIKNTTVKWESLDVS